MTSSTRPGKPTDSRLIESFNGRLCDEFLNIDVFITMHDACKKLKASQNDGNDRHSRRSLGHLTQCEFATMRPGQHAVATNL